MNGAATPTYAPHPSVRQGFSVGTLGICQEFVCSSRSPVFLTKTRRVGKGKKALSFFHVK